MQGKWVAENTMQGGGADNARQVGGGPRKAME
jgi:hypothetical protein